MKPRYKGYRAPQPKVPEAWNKDKETRRLWRVLQRQVNKRMKRVAS